MFIFYFCLSWHLHTCPVPSLCSVSSISVLFQLKHHFDVVRKISSSSSCHFSSSFYCCCCCYCGLCLVTVVVIFLLLSCVLFFFMFVVYFVFEKALDKRGCRTHFCLIILSLDQSQHLLLFILQSILKTDLSAGWVGLKTS